MPVAMAAKPAIGAPGEPEGAHADTMGKHSGDERLKGTRGTWLEAAAAAVTPIRRALGEASKRHERSCMNNRAAAREQARRLGETGTIFRELLSPACKRGRILTTGEGSDTKFLYTA